MGLGGTYAYLENRHFDCNGLVDTNNLPYMNLFALTYGIERYRGHQSPLESSMYRKIFTCLSLFRHKSSAHICIYIETLKY
jgi:hypothetical protein